MSKMIAVRIDDATLAAVDGERSRTGQPRARVIEEALAMWIERRRVREAVRAHADAYARMPVRPDEFEPVLSARRWPR